MGILNGYLKIYCHTFFLYAHIFLSCVFVLNTHILEKIKSSNNLHSFKPATFSLINKFFSHPLLLDSKVAHHYNSFRITHTPCLPPVHVTTITVNITFCGTLIYHPLLVEYIGFQAVISGSIAYDIPSDVIAC